MFGGTKRCQLDGCDRAASANCFCCNKNVCRRHFLEHTDAVKAQTDPLANDTNELVEMIHGLTVDKISEPFTTRLQQWKTDMHQLIDEMFVVKSKEIEDLIATNKEKFVEHKKQQLEIAVEIQDQIKQLVDADDVTSEQIQSLKNQLTSVRTNLTNFTANFLIVNTITNIDGLVNVATNLNKPLFSFPTKFGSTPTTVPNFGWPGMSTATYSHVGSNSTQLTFNGVTNALPNNTPISSSTTVFGSLWGTPSTSTTGTRVMTGVSSSSGPSNPAFQFGTTPMFSFNK